MGDWLAWGFFIAVGIAIGAVAAGWIPIGTARHRSDAHRSRQVIGWSSIVTGTILVLALREPIAFVAAASLVGGGVATIWTARSRSLTDRVKAVQDVDLNAVARRFVFDSRPPARGQLEIHSKAGWTIFMGFAGIGLFALALAAAWDTLGRDHLGLLGKALFIAGLCGFLLCIAAFGMWWAVRAIRRIPMLTLDEFGITWGRRSSGDPSIAWEEVAGIDVRVVRSDAGTDRILIVTPRDPAFLSRQPLLWRIAGRASKALYGSALTISTFALAISFDEIVARIEALRPGLLQPADFPQAS